MRPQEYDKTLTFAFKKTLNLHLDDSQIKQATLPVILGGIGIHTASLIAIPACKSFVGQYTRHSE